MKNTFRLLTVVAITSFTLCITTIPHTKHIPETLPVITESLEDTNMVDFTPNYGISLLSNLEDGVEKE